MFSILIIFTLSQGELEYIEELFQEKEVLICVSLVWFMFSEILFSELLQETNKKLVNSKIKSVFQFIC